MTVGSRNYVHGFRTLGSINAKLPLQLRKMVETTPQLLKTTPDKEMLISSNYKVYKLIPSCRIDSRHNKDLQYRDCPYENK